jgi:hypothetical protein
MKRFIQASKLVVVMLAPVFVYAAAAQVPAAMLVGSSAMPNVSKEEEKAMDKPVHNAFKKCKNDNTKHRDEAASSCSELGNALRDQFKDDADARLAWARACTLGNSNGCLLLGNDYKAAGEMDSARAIWGSKDAGTVGQSALFASYTDTYPPNLLMAEKVGLPLCDEGGDEAICRKLWEMGSQVNFVAIAQKHRDARTEKIAQMEEEASSLDASAASEKAEADRLNAEAKANSGTPGGLGAALKALIYASSYRSDTDKAASLRSQISELKTKQRQANAPSNSLWASGKLNPPPPTN